MDTLSDALAKSRKELNDLKNGAARAVYALDKAIGLQGVVPAPAPAPAPPPAPAPKPNQTKLAIGINLPGYEAWGADSRYGYGYILPDLNHLKSLVGMGIKHIRLPLNWGRFQNQPNGPLNTEELARLKDWLAKAKAAGALVQPENHAFGRTGWGDMIDKHPGVMAQFSAAMVTELKDLIDGYGWMNEPNGVPYEFYWEEAQKTADALAPIVPKLRLYACAAGNGHADGWTRTTPLKDPNDQIIYEIHEYPDPDNSGRFHDKTTIIPLADRVNPFSDWLVKHNKRGWIGEYAGWNTPDHVDALDKFLDYLVAAPNIIGSSYWSGTGWGGAREHQAFFDGQAMPQMAPLLKAR